MTEEGTLKQEWHKKFAIEQFNLVWELLDEEERTVEGNDRMVHAAHASRFHWGEIGTPLEFERGEWQISRVYSVLNRPESALYHARRCLDICQANEIADFDVAFAYEALARAYAVAGDLDESRKYFELGKEAGAEIADAGDREYFFGELNTLSPAAE